MVIPGLTHIVNMAVCGFMEDVTCMILYYIYNKKLHPAYQCGTQTFLGPLIFLRFLSYLLKICCSLPALYIVSDRFLTGIRGVYYLNLHIYKNSLVYTYSVVLTLG